MGPVEASLEADLERVAPEVRASALAAMGRALARTLDADAGVATAPVARELRAVLADLLAFAEPEESRVDDLARARSERKATVSKRAASG